MCVCVCVCVRVYEVHLVRVDTQSCLSIPKFRPIENNNVEGHIGGSRKVGVSRKAQSGCKVTPLTMMGDKR